MQKITQLIEVIKFRPEMYLGEKNIQTLYDFLNGYTMGLHACGFGSEAEILKDFQDWLYVRLKKNASSLHWGNLILKVKANNSKLAFDYFFELFDEFLKTSTKH